MDEAEKLLEKFARKNMVQWNQEFFKRTHGQLHKSIIEALNEALRIHDIVGQSEQLVICKKCGSSAMYQYTKTKDKCEDCGNIQDY